MTTAMDPQLLRRISLFDSLTDHQVARLATEGSLRPFHEGEELFREGDRADVWWVLVEGSITLLRLVGGEESPVGALTEAGQWAGGFAAWDQQGSYFATGRAAGDGRVFALGADRLRALGDDCFALGVHFIQGLANTVRRIEATARQREALVALGTLAAGLAHELNNPASAATRAVDALGTTSATMYESLSELATAQMSPDQFARLDALRKQVQAAPPPVGSMAEAEIEEALEAWLSDHDVPQPWLLAQPLGAAGADVAWCEQVQEAMPGHLLAPAVEWVTSALSMDGLLAEVKESTGRISGLIGRVRSYSQLDRASLQQTDIAEGLDSTVAMLAHKLGDGVVVERDYGADVPRIEAMAAELNQVWTNLIANAVDAMDGHGTVRLRTRLVDRGWVVVEVEDTGPGMSEETAQRLFEPFYTTKPVGQGTGLGLDISRRIVVDHHHGELTVESAPGRTVMQVRLPPR